MTEDKTIRCEYCRQDLSETYMVVIFITPSSITEEYYCSEECYTMGDK